MSLCDTRNNTGAVRRGVTDWATRACFPVKSLRFFSWPVLCLQQIWGLTVTGLFFHRGQSLKYSFTSLIIFMNTFTFTPFRFITALLSHSTSRLNSGHCYRLMWESRADPLQGSSMITMWRTWAPCLTCTLCRRPTVPPSAGHSKHHDQ